MRNNGVATASSSSPGAFTYVTAYGMISVVLPSSAKTSRSAVWFGGMGAPTKR